MYENIYPPWLPPIVNKEQILNNINLITVPPGYGKTYAANHTLPHYFQEITGKEIKYTIIVVPTLTIKEQTLAQYKNTAAISSDMFLDNTYEGIYICCAAQMIQFLKDCNDIKAPHLLIVDEMHQIAEWTKSFNDYILFFSWIYKNKDNMITCGLTATPQLLYDCAEAFHRIENKELFFRELNLPMPPKYTTDRLEYWPRTKPSTILKTLNPSEENKVLVYVESARDCQNLAAKFNGGFLISPYNEDYTSKGEEKLVDLMNAQIVKDKNFGTIELRQFILDYQEMPQEYNLLFINSAYSCGMNIKNESLKTIIIYSDDISTIKQVIGRARHNVDKVIVCNTNYNSPIEQSNIIRCKQAERFIRYADFLEEEYKKQTISRNKEYLESGKMVTDLIYYKYNDAYAVNPFAIGYYDMRQNIAACSEEEFVEQLKEATACEDITVITQKDKKSTIDSNIINIKNFDWQPYLNKRLFKEDRDKIAAELKLKKDYKVLKWSSIIKIIEENELLEVVEKKTGINPNTGKQQQYVILDIAC